MPWPCYLVEYVPCDPSIPDPERPGVSFTALWKTPDGEILDFRKLKVGAIWKHPTRGITVKLPGFSGMNGWAMEQEGSPGNRWTVTGEIPNVTATPSVNCVGTYHGWVTNGVVTDDCEGRKFDDFGKLLE
jgi:hypothetical protein